MEHIKKLLDAAWQRFLDAYEEDPDSHRHEEPLIVKVSKDLSEASVHEREMACFIDRDKNFVFSLEFDAGKPTNFDDIAKQILK